MRNDYLWAVDLFLVLIAVGGIAFWPFFLGALYGLGPVARNWLYVGFGCLIALLLWGTVALQLKH
jgi:hypothetical protein